MSTNLLLVTHRVPFPPDKGDRIRTYHLLRFLAERASIHLACLTDEPVDSETAQELGRCCVRWEAVPLRGSSSFRAARTMALGGTASEGAFRSAQLQRVIQSWTSRTRYQAAFASSSGVARYLRIPELEGATRVVDLVDADSRKWLDYAEHARPPKSWLYRIEARRLRRVEVEIGNWANAVTVVSPVEASQLDAAIPAEKVRVIPNGVDLDYYQPSEEPTSGCVFVGAMDYQPNIDAVCWFAREIWPGIRREHPTEEFRIVGRRPVSEVLALHGRNGVEVIGQVPDVRPSVWRSAVSVAPLRIARGLQNKVLEAMAMGKPVVASPAALAGLGGDGATPAVMASTVAQWIDRVGELVQDQARRRELGLAGREYAEANHDWERCLVPFAELLGLSAEGVAA